MIKKIMFLFTKKEWNLFSLVMSSYLKMVNQMLINAVKKIA